MCCAQRRRRQGRKKVAGKGDVGVAAALDEGIEDLAEMMEELRVEKESGRRAMSGTRELQRCHGRNFDRQASTLRRRLEKMPPADAEPCVKDICEIALPVVAVLGWLPWLAWRATGVLAAPDAAGLLCLGAAACAVVALRRRDGSWMTSAGLLAAVGGAGSLGQLTLLAGPPGLERDLGWTALGMLALAAGVAVAAALTRGRLPTVTPVTSSADR